ncbi:MAG: biopolymer transporter ExbD [Mariniblastus sp.]|nr:biopolymer transporter ExbD [Mariniblastus sp.]
MKLSNKRPIREHAKIELSMTSMIDVVFLLLIFFLVTATFVQPERQILADIHKPGATGALQQPDLQPAVIQISDLNGRTLFQLGAIKTVDLRDLEAPLRGFQHKKHGSFIRVSDGVPFEKVAKVIDLCKTTGFQSVVYVPGD